MDEPIFSTWSIVALVSISVLGIGFAIWSAIKSSKQESKKKEAESKRKKEWSTTFNAIPDFTPDSKYVSATEDVISFDDRKKKLCFFNKDQKAYIYDYSKVLECEIDIDGQTIQKHSTSNTVGRAILGGILTGGVGAIIGGATSSKKQSEVINSMELKVIVDDPANPIFRINFFKGLTKKGSPEYQTAYAEIEKWHAIVTGLMRQGAK